MANCHCKECKKRNGSALSTYLAVHEQELELLQGQEFLREYPVEGEADKYFCIICGSPVYNRNFRLTGLSMVFYGAKSQAKDFSSNVKLFCESRHDREMISVIFRAMHRVMSDL